MTRLPNPAGDVAPRGSVCLGLLAAGVGMATLRLPAAAQVAAIKAARVGLLGVTSPAGYARQIAAMRQGFRELGYVEGQNMLIEYHWADGRYDRLPTLAAELFRSRPDVLVTNGPGTAESRNENQPAVPGVPTCPIHSIANTLPAPLFR